MKYRTISNTELNISVISLGTWQTLGQNVDAKNSLACISRAVELGVNFIDTADCYGYGQAEEFLGKALKSWPRDKIIIGTKCFFPMSDALDDRGLSKKHITRSIENSLRRLKTDYIDLMQCHRFDPDTPLVETLETLHEMQQKGAIRHWGMSRWSAPQMHAAIHVAKQNHWTTPVTQQYFYNLLNPEIEAEVLPTCQQLDISMLAYSPLAQGVLTGKYLPNILPEVSRGASAAQRKTMWNYTEDTLRLVVKLQEVADDLQMSLTQMALTWCLRQPAIASVIVGATQVTQINENISAINKYLSAQDIDRIAAVMRERN